MPATIPSLWPEDIKVDVLQPLYILKSQASKIGELTKGILEAEVTSVTGSDDFVVHRLDLIAPNLDGRRYRVLAATHRADLYPVVLEAECFRPKRTYVAANAMARMASGELPLPSQAWPPADDWRPVANDQDEFIKRVREVLRSGEVRAAINSMIALSNEKSNSSGGSESAA